MPPKPITLPSIAITTSRSITSTRTTKAASAAVLKATASQSPPASSTISQHFERILSLWPSDPLRPANLSFKEYIKARAALARSNNHLNYDNQGQTNTTTNKNNTTEQYHDNVSPTAKSPTLTTPVSDFGSTSTDSPLTNLTGQNHETSDGKADAQPYNSNGSRPGVRSSGGDLQVSSALHMGSKGEAGEAAAGAAANARAGNEREREAGPSAGDGDSSAGATIETTTATATAAGTAGTAGTVTEPTRLAEVGMAPVLKDINALYTLLDDRYTKKFPLSTATLHPASNPNHYDALVAELEEAPTLSWFQKTLRRIRGKIRFK